MTSTNKTVQKLKEAISVFISTKIQYPALTKKLNYSVMSDAETIRNIVDKKLSVSRYGDGEIGMLIGGDIGFQDPNEELVKRMREILNTKTEGHLNCLPIFFKTTDGLTPRVQEYCRRYAVAKHNIFKEIIDDDYLYGSSGFTRFYADFEDKSKATITKKVELLKGLWEDRDVYLVEGEYTRSGVGNDLYDNARSVKRIICPPTNAFAIYDDILDGIKEVAVHDSNTLILCVLGPTATVLAYDLCSEGYQAIDMGHVDIEYEWFLRGTSGKAPVPGKAVNERGGNHPENAITTPQYEKEIVSRIS